MKTMLAYAYNSFGSADIVLEKEKRVVSGPDRGEVLVRVHASGLNPHDTKRRSGWLGGAVPAGGVVPHSDGAGEIAFVGRDVKNRTVGQRVLINGAGHGRYAGTAAQYCLIPVEHTIPIPDSCSYEKAAALGVPAITASYAVLSDGPVTNRWVLIHGGLGAVGRAAVEIASWTGAKVIATVGDPARASELEALGALHVIDRHSELVAERIAQITEGQGTELIVDVDFGANVQINAECIAENGRIASYSSTSVRKPILPYYDFAMKGARLHFVQALNIPKQELERASAVIETLLAQDGLRAVIAHTFPLNEIAAGHSLLESGEAKGKIVYTVD